MNKMEKSLKVIFMIAWILFMVIPMWNILDGLSIGQRIFGALGMLVLPFTWIAKDKS